MSRLTFLLIMIAVVIVIFAAMWIAWRARTRRDAQVATGSRVPEGALIAHFPKVFYISTTPVGDPLSRVAVPALRYRSYGEIDVREDGVTLQLRSEDAVHFDAEQLRGSGLAGRRAGKAVENDGLALMRWDSGEHELESAFRFDDSAQQRAFLSAIDRATELGAAIDAHPAPDMNRNSQEEGTR